MSTVARSRHGASILSLEFALCAASSPRSACPRMYTQPLPRSEASINEGAAPGEGMSGTVVSGVLPRIS